MLLDVMKSLGGGNVGSSYGSAIRRWIAIGQMEVPSPRRWSQAAVGQTEVTSSDSPRRRCSNDWAAAWRRPPPPTRSQKLKVEDRRCDSDAGDDHLLHLRNLLGEVIGEKLDRLCKDHVQPLRDEVTDLRAALCNGSGQEQLRVTDCVTMSNMVTVERQQFLSTMAKDGDSHCNKGNVGLSCGLHCKQQNSALLRKTLSADCSQISVNTTSAAKLVSERADSCVVSLKADNSIFTIPISDTCEKLSPSIEDCLSRGFTVNKKFNQFSPEVVHKTESNSDLDATKQTVPSNSCMAASSCDITHSDSASTPLPSFSELRLSAVPAQAAELNQTHSSYSRRRTSEPLVTLHPVQMVQKLHKALISEGTSSPGCSEYRSGSFSPPTAPCDGKGCSINCDEDTVGNMRPGCLGETEGSSCAHTTRFLTRKNLTRHSSNGSGSQTFRSYRMERGISECAGIKNPSIFANISRDSSFSEPVTYCHDGEFLPWPVTLQPTSTTDSVCPPQYL